MKMTLVQRINHLIVGDAVLDRTARRWCSLGLLLLAAIIGIATYDTGGWFGKEISLRPDLLSGIVALLLISPLYLRRVLVFGNSLYCYLSLVLNVMTMAILVQALLGKAAPLFVNLPMPYLVGFAIIMSWVGMRPFAILVWALVVVVGFINIQSASEAMGLWGFAFIVLVSLGVIMQININTKHLGSELRDDFMGPSAIVAHPSKEHGTQARLSPESGEKS